MAACQISHAADIIFQAVGVNNETGRVELHNRFLQVVG